MKKLIIILLISVCAKFAQRQLFSPNDDTRLIGIWKNYTPKHKKINIQNFSSCECPYPLQLKNDSIFITKCDSLCNPYALCC